LFDAEDPFADRRALDDRKYALDHFQCKLLRLPETMQTDKEKRWRSTMPVFSSNLWPSSARSYRESRWRWMKRFCAALHRSVNRPVIYGTLCKNRPRWLRICRKS
jgi:hypothetical protein